MIARFWREEAGQVIVIVGATMTVLLASLALAVDWGYGLAVRRAMQNSADAAALSVGKALVTSTIFINGQLRFLVSDDQAWDRANAMIQANRGIADNATFSLEYGNAALTWTSSLGNGSTARVPDDTVYVRVRATTNFDTLVAAVIGNQGTTASASARVRLSGAATDLRGYMFPMARHFDASVFSAVCTAPCADPTQAGPIKIIDNQGTIPYGQFDGFLDFSRYSHNEDTNLQPPRPEQLLASWDRTGSPDAGTALKPNAVGQQCPFKHTHLWDTSGNENDNQQNKSCSLPNWAYYSFGGTLSLTSDYTVVVDPRTAPTLFSNNSKAAGCGLTDAQFEATYGFRLEPRAACDRGDWVETALRMPESDIDKVMAAVRARIALDGGEGPLSSKIVASGQNAGQTYGKALTMLVLLWDCAEEWQSQGGGRWRPIPRNVPSDCTQIPSGQSADTPGRVHIMSMAPFTIYEGLVTRHELFGYWGGGFGEVPPDAPRPLWVFANTAYLVPDED